MLSWASHTNPLGQTMNSLSTSCLLSQLWRKRGESRNTSEREKYQRTSSHCWLCVGLVHHCHVQRRRKTCHTQLESFKEDCPALQWLRQTVLLHAEAEQELPCISHHTPAKGTGGRAAASPSPASLSPYPSCLSTASGTAGTELCLRALDCYATAL